MFGNKIHCRKLNLGKILLLLPMQTGLVQQHTDRYIELRGGDDSPLRFKSSYPDSNKRQ